MTSLGSISTSPYQSLDFSQPRNFASLPSMVICADLQFTLTFFAHFMMSWFINMLYFDAWINDSGNCKHRSTVRVMWTNDWIMNYIIYQTVYSNKASAREPIWRFRPVVMVDLWSLAVTVRLSYLLSYNAGLIFLVFVTEIFFKLLRYVKRYSQIWP